MPLRVLPGRWSWIVLVIFTALNVALNTVVSVNLAQRAIDADRRARAEASEANRPVLCLLVTSQERVMRQQAEIFSEAESEIGRRSADAWRDAAKSWHDLGILFRCYQE